MVLHEASHKLPPVTKFKQTAQNTMRNKSEVIIIIMITLLNEI